MKLYSDNTLKIDQTLKWRSELPQNGSSNQLITGEASAEKLD